MNVNFLYINKRNKNKMNIYLLYFSIFDYYNLNNLNIVFNVLNTIKKQFDIFKYNVKTKYTIIIDFIILFNIFGSILYNAYNMEF